MSVVMANLAAVYAGQGRAADAEALYRRTLAVQEKTLGAAHPTVANTLNNLAEVYRSQNRLKDAEQLFRTCLAGKRNAWGRATRTLPSP